MSYESSQFKRIEQSLIKTKIINIEKPLLNNNSKVKSDKISYFFQISNEYFLVVTNTIYDCHLLKSIRNEENEKNLILNYVSSTRIDQSFEIKKILYNNNNIFLIYTYDYKLIFLKLIINEEKNIIFKKINDYDCKTEIDLCLFNSESLFYIKNKSILISRSYTFDDISKIVNLSEGEIEVYNSMNDIGECLVKVDFDMSCNKIFIYSMRYIKEIDLYTSSINVIYYDECESDIRQVLYDNDEKYFYFSVKSTDIRAVSNENNKKSFTVKMKSNSKVNKFQLGRILFSNSYLQIYMNKNEDIIYIIDKKRYRFENESVLYTENHIINIINIKGNVYLLIIWLGSIENNLKYKEILLDNSQLPMKNIINSQILQEFEIEKVENEHFENEERQLRLLKRIENRFLKLKFYVNHRKIRKILRFLSQNRNHIVINTEKVCLFRQFDVLRKDISNQIMKSISSYCTYLNNVLYRVLSFRNNFLFQVYYIKNEYRVYLLYIIREIYISILSLYEIIQTGICNDAMRRIVNLKRIYF